MARRGPGTAPRTCRAGRRSNFGAVFGAAIGPVFRRQGLLPASYSVYRVRLSSGSVALLAQTGTEAQLRPGPSPASAGALPTRCRRFTLRRLPGPKATRYPRRGPAASLPSATSAWGLLCTVLHFHPFLMRTPLFIPTLLASVHRYGRFYLAATLTGLLLGLLLLSARLESQAASPQWGAELPGTHQRPPMPDAHQYCAFPRPRPGR